MRLFDRAARELSRPSHSSSDRRWGSYVFASCCTSGSVVAVGAISMRQRTAAAVSKRSSGQFHRSRCAPVATVANVTQLPGYCVLRIGPHRYGDARGGDCSADKRSHPSIAPKRTQRRYRRTDRSAEQPRSAKQLRESGNRSSRSDGSWPAGQPGHLLHLLRGECGVDRRGFHRAELRERIHPVRPEESRASRSGPRRRRDGSAGVGPGVAGQDAVLHCGRRRTSAGTHAADRDSDRCRGGAGPTSARGRKSEPSRPSRATGLLCAVAAGCVAGRNPAFVRP